MKNKQIEESFKKKAVYLHELEKKNYNYFKKFILNNEKHKNEQNNNKTKITKNVSKSIKDSENISINNSSIDNRFIEIDFIKGLAVLTMVIFHYFYLCTVMNFKQYNINSGILHFLAEFSHNVFIFMSGLNLTISSFKQSKKKTIKKKFKRGIFLICIGLVITFLTKFDFPFSFVKFGIFHFLGLATILGSLYSDMPKFSLFLAFIILVLNYLLNMDSFKSLFSNFCEKNPLLCFISGIMNLKYNSIDHFSLIPYLGLFSLGISFGHLFYNNKNKKIKRTLKSMNFLDKYNNNKIVRLISYIGKNSLIIYILHFVIFYLIVKLQIKNKNDKKVNRELFDNLYK